MSVHRLPTPRPLALPEPEALDELDAAQLVAVAERAAALQAGALARLARAPASSSSASATGAHWGDAWLTSTQAAAHLNVPVSWIAEKARAGVLRSHKLGHYLRFRRRELDEDATGLAAPGQME